MSRIIAIEPRAEGAMVALVVDGRLEDLLIDPPAADTAPQMEEIHRVRVRRLIPKQGGAMVKLEDGLSGYLRDTSGLEEGALMIAQVSGMVEPGKAVPMTSRRLHRGKFAILTPHAPGVNVARSLKDPEERARLAAIGAERIGADGPGLILRTAAADEDAEAILTDIDDLLALEAVVSGALAAGGPPAKLTEGPGAELTAWREWGTPDEVIREPGLFDRMGLWDEIDTLRTPRADLRDGGWMAIEPTAALIAVDINTGADMAGNAAAKANLAACTDLPRQLRLRGLGGQITIDFAPMRKVDRTAVELALKRAFAADPIQTTLAGWTPLGCFEMTRKRERRPIIEVLPDA